jgi:hypothetical protein
VGQTVDDVDQELTEEPLSAERHSSQDGVFIDVANGGQAGNGEIEQLAETSCVQVINGGAELIPGEQPIRCVSADEEVPLPKNHDEHLENADVPPMSSGASSDAVE